MGIEDGTDDANDVIELPDGRRLVRIPMGPDGKPERPGYRIGQANLGSRPQIKRIPELRVLEIYEHVNGEMGGALAAYPQLRVLREGGEIDVEGRGSFRILKATQARSRNHSDKRSGEVLLDLILEPV